MESQVQEDEVIGWKTFIEVEDAALYPCLSFNERERVSSHDPGHLRAWISLEESGQDGRRSQDVSQRPGLHDQDGVHFRHQGESLTPAYGQNEVEVVPV